MERSENNDRIVESTVKLSLVEDLPNVGRTYQTWAGAQSEKSKKFVIALLQLKAVNMRIQLVLICRRSAAVVALGSNIQVQNALPREASVLSVATLGTTPRVPFP